MKTTVLEMAFLKLNDGSSVELINPILECRHGGFFIDGVIRNSRFKVQEDYDREFNIKVGTYPITEEDYLSLEAEDTFGNKIQVTKVKYTQIDYYYGKVKLISHGELIRTRDKASNIYRENSFHSIGIDGISLEFDQQTFVEKKRHIAGREEIIPVSARLDYLETNLELLYQGRFYQIDVSFIENEKENLVYMRVEGRYELPQNVYFGIKVSFIAFLSFAVGNRVLVREEFYNKDGKDYDVFYSRKRIKFGKYSKYIPLAEIQFRHKNILDDYLKSFKTFLFLDKILGLAEIVSLLNQARKLSTNGGFFIMLVALERLADNFVKSTLSTVKQDHIIESDNFKVLFKPVRESFEKEFEQIKKDKKVEYNLLLSKLCGINKVNKTDNKILKLLDYVDIPITTKLTNLFTKVRNTAIHEGDIDVPKGNAHMNYRNLELLLNDVIANLIQYRGIRFIKSEGKTTYISQKQDFSAKYMK